MKQEIFYRRMRREFERESNLHNKGRIMAHVRKESRGGGLVIIDAEECKGCGLCVEVCPPTVLQISEALNRMGYHPAEYKGIECTGCGVCFYVCPEPGAITVYKRMELKTSAVETVG
jgi:NAD-dependent dihydropyrimidine dehydrogenase PreA subunit